jgi:hypothetical protein
MLTALARSLTPGANDNLVPPAPRPAQPKKPPTRLSIGPAWAAWTAHGAAAADDFLHSVASWMDGTSAQLLRRATPAGAKRPTTAEVKERLHHHLDAAAKAGEADYLEALAAAKQNVLEEMQEPAKPVKPRALAASDTRQ